MDLISIIVPVYNVEKYLRRNLDSLVNQSYQKIEIIVVNDGSPDQSDKIIKEYEKKYPNLIKSFKKKNGGLSSARNFGIDVAKGKYFVFIDSDDYVETDFIEKLYNSIIENKSEISICDIYDDYENTNKTVTYRNYIPNIPVSISKDKKQLLNRFATWNKMYSSKLFKKGHRFTEGKIYEDLILITKLLVEANKISYVNEPLYHYIIRDGSIMTSSNLEKNLDIIFAFEDVLAYFKREKLFDFYKDELEFMVTYHVLIAAVSRVIRASSFSTIKKNVKVYRDFVYENFSDYKNNKYLVNLSFGSKILLFLIRNRMYFLTKILLRMRGLR